MKFNSVSIFRVLFFSLLILGLQCPGFGKNNGMSNAYFGGNLCFTNTGFFLKPTVSVAHETVSENKSSVKTFSKMCYYESRFQNPTTAIYVTANDRMSLQSIYNLQLSIS
ncbi:MAG: hypothetical protein ABI763_13605 [Bacteroidota bacterium]